MPKRNQTPKWGDVRRTLSSKSQNELLNLIRDLYALQPEVKAFIDARYVVSTVNLNGSSPSFGPSLSPCAIS